MLGGTEYFFDSYAILARIFGAEGYADFSTSNGVTTLLNLMEVQYSLYRRGLKDEGIRGLLKEIRPMCIGFSDDDCYEAVKFRYGNRRKGLSYIDCLGYVLAKKNRVLFLTGDKGFEGLPNVKFVKWQE